MKANERVEQDIALAKLRGENRTTKASYAALIKRLAIVERERDAALQLSSPSETYRITPTQGLSSEATAVFLASDWHMEEHVTSESVSGLNTHSMAISLQRSNTFFVAARKMLQIFSRDIPINNAVLWLGGDFISGNIHDENLETSECPPIEAAIEVQKRIESGIKFLLDNTKCTWVIPCSCGNHSRITKKLHIATEKGNSLEAFMYHSITRHFEGHPRIRFQLPTGYWNYVDVMGFKLRFHHGNAIKSCGGIGGLFPPVYKKIQAWNKAKHADYDCFGHFHGIKDGGNFVINGSLIGYNPFAISIGADFEKPKQLCFLVDKNRGKTVTCPIVV